MKIRRIKAQNFRMLKNSMLELQPELSLLIGRNNSGKTSFLILFEKFYSDSSNFTFDDFPIEHRKEILDIAEDTDESNLAIRMLLEIEYSETDDLDQLSNFILDLDDSSNTVKILFECSIDKKRLLKDLEDSDSDKSRYIRKYLSNYLKKNIFALENEDHISSLREGLVHRDIKKIKDLINFEIIHAKRDVASSEGGKKILSKLTTQYFNKKNNEPALFDPINDLIISMDESLEKAYTTFFDQFLDTSKKFLGINNIKVISNLESNEILENSSQVVYGADQSFLPETFNGLGHMNILYLLLTIEIKKESFTKNHRQINLLFIEEPEAHTHPQMQYIFSNKIKSLLSEIENLQTLITTHSSHIVSQCDFKDVRYFRCNNSQVEIKNFHSELKSKYAADIDSFNFIEQYLTLNSCELFFASKVVFIEGISERILWPYFVEKQDFENKHNTDYVPISSQNITILEAGANAKAFQPFLELLEIKTLIITDIDTTKFEKDGDKSKGGYIACRVTEATHTSNATLKYYLSAPEHKKEEEFKAWFKNFIEHKLTESNKLVKVSYQTFENGYNGRSFEDAFYNINKDKIELFISKISGIKNTDQLKSYSDPYEAIENIISKKSTFASSLLYLALTNSDATWETPQYIKDGLEWIAQ
ncbi:ATP-dependent nuclease [Pseudomonas citronellolis]|uniref:ATP-dependent nuclease n=1 Tax=Pseudomonas citronellolis TaxID=53408 RepID=UPI0021BEA874|nr:ATP-dependent endonuclease [Pseudomonas citronellolis]UXJ53510.1 ATP-dependent endonuclease [Pseudomonas citronellolis]